jgi:hypothetical protein
MSTGSITFDKKGNFDLIPHLARLATRFDNIGLVFGLPEFEPMTLLSFFHNIQIKLFLIIPLHCTNFDKT